MSRPAHAAPRPRPALALSALILTGAAIVAVFTQAPGEVIADARYEHVAAPTQFLARHASVWDDERTLGAPTQYFSPVIGAYQAGLAELGAPPWIIQRSTHALLLAISGFGATMLARSLLHDRLAWVVAGLLYAFNPYTTQFLIPSGLFMAYAIAPWISLAAVEGSRPGADRWRWGALVALSVFAVGMLNVSSLLLAAFPALVLVLVRIGTRASRWRDAAAWVWRAGVLTLGVTTAMLVTLSLTVENIRFNLETTESPETVAATSSAAESWRGLGLWLSYFRFTGEQVRDQAAPYFTNPIVIGASFVPLILAAAAQLVRPSRLTAGLAGLAALTIVLMVGIHPVGDPSPLGWLLERAFDESLFARGFRSTYKAGAGLQLAVALLAGLTVARLVAWPGGRAGRSAVAAVVLAALGTASFPFWTGGLYPSTERHEELPAHWEEAFEWFDSQPHEPGVLVLPSLARTRYRWGFVNDTLFDAHLAQPAVSARTLPQSTRILADLTEAVDARAADGWIQPGSLGPIMRRMGVRWLLLQNDLDWVAAGVPRPATYDPMREDPDLRLVASFGEPDGRPRAFDVAGVVEAELAPVEVYELVDPRPPGALVTSAPIVVAGGGEAWPALARAGWLEHPVLLAAELDDDFAEVAPTAEAVVFTDGAQRRAARVASGQSTRSPILALGEDAGRPVQAVAGDPEDQSLVVYPDLDLVGASSYGRRLIPWDARWRPANAVDGNPHTAWASEAASPTLRLVLAEPTPLESIALEPFGDRTSQPLSSATVELFGADGAVVHAASIDDLDRQLDLPDGVPVRELAITVERGDGVRGLVGLAEVSVGGVDGPVDGRELVRVPGPADEAAGRALDGALGGVEVHHLFAREPEQALVNRAFWSPGGETRVRASVRIDENTPDAVIDALIGSEVSAVAERRFLGEPEASGRNVLDGDISTAWQLHPTRSGSLTLHVPGYVLDEIQLWLVVEGHPPVPLSRVRQLEVEVAGADGETVVGQVSLDAEPECDPAFSELGEGICVERVILELDPRAVDSIRIEPVNVEAAATGLGVSPAQLADVRLLRDGTELIDADARRGDDTCRPWFLLDGEPVALQPDRPVTLATLTAGLELAGCDDLALAPGWHRLDGVIEASFAVDTVELSPIDTDVDAGTETAVRYEQRTSTRRRLAPAAVRAGDIVVSDVPAHDGWRVSATGVAGRRVVADGFVAWQATTDGTVRLDLRFAPQRWYRLAWLVSAVTVAVSLWLLLPGRRENR